MPAERTMPNLLWPRARSPVVGPSGLIGRVAHWLGAALAIGFLLTAMGFVADGWALPLATELALAAIAAALGGRAVRYLLAKE
jgi:hypothetical protein